PPATAGSGPIPTYRLSSPRSRTTAPIGTFRFARLTGTSNESARSLRRTRSSLAEDSGLANSSGGVAGLVANRLICGRHAGHHCRQIGGQNIRALRRAAIHSLPNWPSLSAHAINHVTPVLVNYRSRLLELTGAYVN